MASLTACARCQSTVPPGARFCMHCGSDVTGELGAGALPSAIPTPVLDQPVDALRRATAGEYQILSELGRGGMATVFLAQDLALERRVAIKVMAPHLAQSPGMAERFRLEARTAAGLSHPHIIPIYAVKQVDGLLFFVMKYVAGRPLDLMLRELGPLPIPLVRTILGQVGSALAYAHRKGVVHRDVKPGNILIDEDGNAVVTDFGIAKVAAGQHLTLTGSTVGTPAYMSPEQCAGGPVTAASDQYSLGVVGYELLTGRSPFAADSVLGMLWSHFNEIPRPVQDLRVDCPDALAEVVMRMLAKAPEARWPTLADAVAAIAKVHDGEGGAGLIPAVGGPRSPVQAVRRVAEAVTLRTDGYEPVASLTLSPASCSLRVGETIRLGVIARDARGAAVPGRTMIWASSDPGVVTVSPSGLVTAHRAGAATVTGTVDGRRASVRVVVTAAVEALRLAVDGGTATVGESIPLRALLAEDTGASVHADDVSWTTSDPSVLRVSEDGTLTALRVGTAVVGASHGELRAEAVLHVTRVGVARIRLAPEPRELPAGEEVRLVATCVDRLGGVLTGRLVVWSSSDPGVAAVTTGGLVIAQRPGVARILASSGGATEAVTLKVTPPRPAALRIDPAETLLRVGEETRLRAVPLNSGGREIEGLAASWVSMDPRVATVSPEGVVTAVRVGAVKIGAVLAGRRATAAVLVVPHPARQPGSAHG